MYNSILEVINVFHSGSYERYLENGQVGEVKDYGNSQGQGLFHHGDLCVYNKVSSRITEKWASSVAIAVFVKLVCPN